MRRRRKENLLGKMKPFLAARYFWKKEKRQRKVEEKAEEKKGDKKLVMKGSFLRLLSSLAGKGNELFCDEEK